MTTQEFKESDTESFSVLSKALDSQETTIVNFSFYISQLLLKLISYINQFLRNNP